MTPNPFIQLLERPVETLTLAGYFISMVAIALLGLSYVLREGAMVAILAGRDHRRGAGPYDSWWGEWADGFVPPAAWVLRATKVIFVAVFMLWALATVVYIA